MYVMRNDGSADEEAKAEWYKTGRHNAVLAEVIKALPSVTQKSDEQLYKNGFADGYEQGHKDAEQKSGKCSTCEYEEDKDSGECYECVKGIQDWYKPKQTVRQTGKWIDKEISNPDFPYQDRKIIECSQCHYGIVQARLGYTNYCPNCGSYNGGDNNGNE